MKNLLIIAAFVFSVSAMAQTPKPTFEKEGNLIKGSSRKRLLSKMVNRKGNNQKVRTQRDEKKEKNRPGNKLLLVLILLLFFLFRDSWLQSFYSLCNFLRNVQRNVNTGNG